MLDSREFRRGRTNVSFASLCRAAVGLLLLLAGAAGCSDLTTPPRNKPRAYLAASVKSVAFPVRNLRGEFALLLLDYETGEHKKLGVNGSSLLSPYLSPDGARLLFVRHPRGEGGRELVACETSTLHCKSMVKSEGSISYPIELSGGRILYVESPKWIHPDGRALYQDNDFWLLGQAGPPLKLTDMKLYQIRSVSASDKELYFSAMPDATHSVIPEFDSGSLRKSEIFKLPFDQSLGRIEIPPHKLSPLFRQDGIAISPSVSADGSIVAYLRSANSNPYRFDLVIEDLVSQSTRLVTSGGLGFSSPVVVGKSVYANDTSENQFGIRVAQPGKIYLDLLAVITNASIDAMETIELKVSQ